MRITMYCDSSWGTGPNGRSICGILCKLAEKSGCISTKSTASLTTVRMSSFESELETFTVTFKGARRVSNTFEEMGVRLKQTPMVWNDNEKMIEFVKGEASAKGTKHMELRMFYCREQLQVSNVNVGHMGTAKLPSDMATKPSDRAKFGVFADCTLGVA